MQIRDIGLNGQILSWLSDQVGEKVKCTKNGYKKK